VRIEIVGRLSWVQRICLAFWKAIVGDVAGPMLVVSYRKDYFGNYWAACMQEGMRTLHQWTKGEIELFAAFTSKVNSCTY
jgi:hypothetical protein